jgi:hypothetical protein
VELEGRLSSLAGECPNVTFELRGRKVLTNGETSFRGGRCDRLRNGREVEVRGVVQTDGRVLATRVEQDDD